MNPTNLKDYAALLQQVKERIRAAQYEALKMVNKELINLYWDIGKMIVERQEKEGWGKSVVECLAKKYGWTKNVLALKIEGKSYENTFLNQTNFNQTVPDKIKNQAKLAVKDEYTFGFLELGENYNEREFEQAILSRMDKFLREMGGSLAFVGSQYRLEVGEKEFFIDILLYHRYLKSLIANSCKACIFLGNAR